LDVSAPLARPLSESEKADFSPTLLLTFSLLALADLTSSLAPPRKKTTKLTQIRKLKAVHDFQGGVLAKR